MSIDNARFAKIHEHIQAEDGFAMHTWEYGGFCGTTRCVAGWAIYDEIGAALYDGSNQVSVEVHHLADRLRVNDYMEDIGAALLGLPDDLRSVFYTDEELAAEFVRRAAGGATEDDLREWLEEEGNPLDF